MKKKRRLLSLERKTEKLLKELGCRERVIKAHRDRQQARGQLDVDGKRFGRRKTIEQSVREWRESIAILAGDDE